MVSSTATASAALEPGGALAHRTSSYDHQSVKRIQNMGEKVALDCPSATEYEGHRLLVRPMQLLDEPPRMGRAVSVAAAR